MNRVRVTAGLLALAGDSCQPADIWKECGPIQEDYDACKAACEEEMARRSRK